MHFGEVHSSKRPKTPDVEKRTSKGIYKELVASLRTKIYGLKGCKARRDVRKMCLNKSDLLKLRGNSLIFINEQFPRKRKTIKQVKPESSISDPVHLSSWQGKNSYKLIGKNNEEMKVHVMY